MKRRHEEPDGVGIATLKILVDELIRLIDPIQYMLDIVYSKPVADSKIGLVKSAEAQLKLVKRKLDQATITELRQGPNLVEQIVTSAKTIRIVLIELVKAADELDDPDYSPAGGASMLARINDWSDKYDLWVFQHGKYLFPTKYSSSISIVKNRSAQLNHKVLQNIGEIIGYCNS